MFRASEKLHMLPGLLSAPCSVDRAFQEAFFAGFAHTGLPVTGRDASWAKNTPKAVLRPAVLFGSSFTMNEGPQTA